MAKRENVSVPVAAVVSSPKKVYYSHAKNIVNTQQEKDDIATLEAMGLKVDSPYHPKYIEFWETEGIEFGKVLIEANDVFAFRALTDGRLPAGVAKELRWAQEAGKPIIELPYSVDLRVSLNVTETVAEYNKAKGA